MELYQARYFINLAKTLNFTRAAEACNVTQPALTRAVQRLEDEFGGPLLHRERNLTQLTELGRQLLPLIEQTYNAAETAKALALGFKQRADAPLRLGLGVALSGGRQPVSSGTVARPLAAAEAQRAIMLAAVAGRQQGPGVAAFLKLMRARDWGDGPAARPKPTARGGASIS